MTSNIDLTEQVEDLEEDEFSQHPISDLSEEEADLVKVPKAGLKRSRKVGFRPSDNVSLSFSQLQITPLILAGCLLQGILQACKYDFPCEALFAVPSSLRFCHFPKIFFFQMSHLMTASILSLQTQQKSLAKHLQSPQPRPPSGKRNMCRLLQNGILVHRVFTSFWNSRERRRRRWAAQLPTGETPMPLS